tara:strand:- start:906 stop:1691 length:786 start_codon:yes stop_codon:yes gene_type:complete
VIFLLIIFLLLTNVFTIYILNRKKIRVFFTKSKIKSVNLEKLDKIFENEKVSENLYRPKDETIVKSFCTNLGENDVIGKTSDYEAWIISSLSKKSKNIFEFGTCSGKTTTLMAINSPADTKIVTLTINVDQAQNLDLDVSDNKTSIRNIVNESQYQKFIFTGKKYENKIEVKFLDSRKLDTLPYRNKFDLIFIDGGHTYSLVKNDTEKAFEMIKKGGIVLWHDYVPLKKSCKDVVKLIDEFSEKKKVFHLKNTSLCFSIAN